MNFKQSIYMHIITIFFVLLGSIDTIINQLSGKSLFQYIPNQNMKMGLVVVIGVSILYHLLNKHTYLPFLSYNVLPYSLLRTENPKLSGENIISTTIEVPTNNKYSYIMYWASQGSKSQEIPMWDVAYGEFENSGVENVENKSVVTISFNCPVEYNVPKLKGSKKLPKHVHYRFVTKDGMMSSVYTKNVKC